MVTLMLQPFEILKLNLLSFKIDQYSELCLLNKFFGTLISREEIDGGSAENDKSVTKV